MQVHYRVVQPPTLHIAVRVGSHQPYALPLLSSFPGVGSAPQNDLTFLRIRSKKHEIMVAPEKEYMLIVIQEPPKE